MRGRPGGNGVDGDVKKDFHRLFLPAVFIIVLDQVSKWTVVRFIPRSESIRVTEFFNLVHVRNRGMAFGIMNRPDLPAGYYLLLAGTLAAVVLISVFLFRLRERDLRMGWGLSLVLGGAVGNLVDRLRYRAVIDFLDVHLWGYHWPAFNAADSAITVGVFLLAAAWIFRAPDSGPDGKGPP